VTGLNLPYDSYTGDTTHRFYQMWQQSDCSIQNATEDNPTGCLNDLYPFVITTYGGPTADHGGGTSMAFYNMLDEDAPLFKKLADEYTINDNYHQPGQGGTGIQHVFLGSGDDIFWSDGEGNPTVPPSAQIASTQSMEGSAIAPMRSMRLGCCQLFSTSILSPTQWRPTARLTIITC
jgi:phospholipase C